LGSIPVVLPCASPGLNPPTFLPAGGSITMGRACWSAVLAGLLLMTTAGCGRNKPSSTAYAADSAMNLQRRPMHGMVLGKSSTTGQITVRQDVIRNFMPAMDAVYTIGNAATLRELQPGDHISATILAPSDGSPNRLTDIVETAEPAHPLTSSEVPPHRLLEGEAVPDIPLLNQDGQTVHFPLLHGKAVLLTFIDTRCTEDCPILTGRFQKVNRLLAQDPQAFAGSHLLTVSIDPAHDKPAVLRKYGLQYLDGNANGFAHWSFVDLTPANLKKLATSFGVFYRPSRDDIIHTMVTALIGPGGTVQKVWTGDDWNPKDVAQAVESSVSGTKSRL
jgi:protein SCO1/2